MRDRAQASDEEESILAGAGLTVICARLVPPIPLADRSPVRLSVDEKQLTSSTRDREAIDYALIDDIVRVATPPQPRVHQDVQYLPTGRTDHAGTVPWPAEGADMRAV